MWQLNRVYNYPLPKTLCGAERKRKKEKKKKRGKNTI
jgi:hypothetical protein